MRALASGFDGRLSTLRTTRACADSLWHAFEGVSANDRSPGRAAKVEALLREVGVAEHEAQEAMLAAGGEILRLHGAVERSRRMLHLLVLFLLAEAVWLCWLHQ
jgi:hypothetical protein